MDLEKNDTLFRFVVSEMRHLRGGVAIAILRSLCIAPLPWLFGMMIDRHVPAADVRGLLVTSWIFAALLLLHMAFAITAARKIGGGVTEIVKDLRSLIFNRLQFLHFGYLDRSTSGRLLSKYAFDTQKVQDITVLMLNQFLPTTCYGFSVMFIMLLVDWRLSLVVLLIMPMVVTARIFFRKKLKRQNQEVRLAQEKLTGSANEMISALRLVRSLGEETKAEHRLKSDNHDVAETRVGLINISSVFGTYIFVNNQFVSLIVVCAGAIMVIEGQMSVGVLFSFVAALPIIMQPFTMVTQFIEQYAMGQESYRSIRELVCSRYVEQWKGDSFPAEFRGDIRFRNVRFAYPSKENTPVFESLNLHIRAGESVALVGASGSGKSSIANLILGLYSISGGQIEVDGMTQDQLDMRRFRRQCAIVLQENILLSGSIMENIRFAKSEATDEEVRQAAIDANADEFIRNLPEGYHSIIGERGVSLSGGQKQRLSIARAILRNPRVLILDEATSALDNESEALIQQALERLSRGRTVITIAHRLSTIRNADRIIVLGDGRILEEGDYETLRKANGAFSVMSGMG
ncbi:MAG: ABC transporter ATP-binding protein [Verrucomicrobia bacterium]|nr:ABC transporter ATP-binding protein [Verrucomicrobiota bacterium]MCH8511030.1 ABC transporter ATP-binding protein/permease [Kiritimatiellia bacterium]